MAGQLIFMYVDRHVALPPGANAQANLSWNFANVLNAVTNAAAAAIGILLVTRRPENRIGWLFLAAAVSLGVSGFSSAYGVHALWTEPGSLPAGNLMAWLGTWTGFVPLAAITILFLLFPTGRPLSPRWSVVTKAVAAAWSIAIGASAFFSTLSWSDPFQQKQSSPTGLETIGFLVVLALPLLATFAASIIGVVVRYRRSTGDERLQLKWFAVGAVLVLVTILATIISSAQVVVAIQDAATIFFFIAVAIAILKYRLYEIDVVINRAVIYGTLAVFITLVYVGLVVGIGTLVGNNRSPLLSAVAAAVVAVAFQPVRQWARRLANRVVYGSRATPYEVLSDFAERIAGTYAAEDVLPQMAQIVAAGTGAERTVVWLRVGDELRAEASSGARAGDGGHPRPGRRDAADARGRVRRGGHRPGRAAGRDLGSDASRANRCRSPASASSRTWRRRRAWCSPTRASSRSCGRRASASWRPRTRRGAGSSATSTTARNSSWSRWR